MACVAVDVNHVRWAREGPPPEEFDDKGDSFVTLVFLSEDEGHMDVGLSYLIPRIYALLDGPGWENFVVEDGEVAIP